MMEERGTVIEHSDGVAVVHIERSEACEGCTFCTPAENGRAMLARAVDRVGVSVGDRVRIQTKSPSPLVAALMLFMVPFAFLFAGYGAGALAASLLKMAPAAQPLGAGSALLFFVVSFSLLSRVSGNGRGKGPSSIIIEKL
ncbi:MAG TPA: SoxR reducing system RseC family protein [Spirochaetia bacterium]|nr:SoxR reducing system RseC family protein [Spirochaetia bacterium]